MIAPNSRIILLKCPIELDNNNQLTFANATSQYNYFYGLTKLELDEATFQRKDGVIRFNTDEEAPNGISYEDLLQYNYVMYQNTSYGNKWFYAFITNIIWVNNGLTDIEIKTDVFQTWQFNVTWKRSFIEREHIAKASDTIGANTLPENLETGEYIPNGNPTEILNNMETYYCVAVSDITDELASSVAPTNREYNGVFSGYYYIVFDSVSDVQNFIKQYAILGKLDAIYSLFIVPKDLTISLTWGNWTVTQGGTSITSKLAFVNSSSSSTLIVASTIDIKNTLDGYTPVNKKCYTWPYNYILMTNHAGTNATYKWELCENDEQTGKKYLGFYIVGVITPGCSMKIRPYPYNKLLAGKDTFMYGIPLQKLPICTWNGDVYTNWLTQNAVNIPLQLGSGILSMATGIASGNIISGASGGIAIGQSLSSIYEHSLVPNEARGNSNISDVNFSSEQRGVTVYQMCCKSEYLRVIDNYFSMYGYATKLLKLPNLNNRTNWNYVKTIDANIIGDIPQNDMQEYKGLFNKGITLWHNPSTFLDYSQSNN